MSTRKPPSFVQRRTLTISSVIPHDCASPHNRDERDEKGSEIIINRPGISSRMSSGPVASLARVDENHKSSLGEEAHIEGRTVLVINASQEMAQEITVELSATLPGSTILFAPTLSLALWILKRRSIDLVLSSSKLPDAPIQKLHEFLELLSPPPELVIVSDLKQTRSHMGYHPGYRFVELRRLTTGSSEQEVPPTPEVLSELGADIRNDLNNPLQEIVAMAFVAHASEGLSPMAEEALSAIQRAAENMSHVVNSLEDKIRGAVARTAA
jgi:signal transduction histidine kinase